ncbi:MAG: DUF2273 domain-containing protein [Clostridia bacterium]|nr:DUF2273 domain-containing protein [Clostridia bacterium]
MNDKMKTFTENMFKIGTFECAAFCGAAALVIAVLILLLGFWQTVLVLAFLLLGLFLGGVKDKKGWLRNVINRLFPARQVTPYKAEDVRINREEKKEENTEEA